MKKYIIIVFILLCFGTSRAGQQTSGATTYDIIDAARLLIGGQYQSGATHVAYFDTAMLSYVNMGLKDIAAKTGCMDTAYTITLSNGVTEYAISSSISYFYVSRVIYQTGITAWQGLRRGNPQSIGNATTAKQPVFWYPNGDNVVIYPSPETSGNTIYVMMSQKPPAVGLNSAIPTPAIYDNALVYFVSAMSLLQVGSNRHAMYLNLYLEDIKFYGQHEILPVEPVKEIIK